jgi:Zn-dependent protease
MAESCGSCAIELAPSLLACPACHTLVHRDRLGELARDAESADAVGEPERALELWRSALVLLPPNSRQHAAVAEKIDAAVRASQTIAKQRRAGRGILGTLGAVLIALLTKAKLLLLGITKLGAFTSILLSFGIYWSAWGWRYAAAILGAIYIHEIGHVAALHKRGMAASAPMFVPGFGAFVRMHEHAKATPSEDARVGLAGPIWGLGAAAIAIALYAWTRSPFWLAVGQTVGQLTLLNLTPVWQLDGSRGFHPMSRMQKWLVVVVTGLAFAFAREGMLVLVGLAALWRAIEKQPERKPDWIAFAQYVALLVAGVALSVTMRR